MQACRAAGMQACRPALLMKKKYIKKIVKKKKCKHSKANAFVLCKTKDKQIQSKQIQTKPRPSQPKPSPKQPSKAKPNPAKPSKALLELLGWAWLDQAKPISLACMFCLACIACLAWLALLALVACLTDKCCTQACCIHASLQAIIACT